MKNSVQLILFVLCLCSSAAFARQAATATPTNQPGQCIYLTGPQCVHIEYSITTAVSFVWRYLRDPEIRYMETPNSPALVWGVGGRTQPCGVNGGSYVIDGKSDVAQIYVEGKNLGHLVGCPNNYPVDLGNK